MSGDLVASDVDAGVLETYEAIERRRAAITPRAAFFRELRELVENTTDRNGQSITVDRLFGRERLKELGFLREIVWARLRQRGWSYPEIGAAFGRDHSTILSVINPTTRARKTIYHREKNAIKSALKRAQALQVAAE